jgi:hypothetical protein
MARITDCQLLRVSASSLRSITSDKIGKSGGGGILAKRRTPGHLIDSGKEGSGLYTTPQRKQAVTATLLALRAIEIYFSLFS